MRRMVAQHWEIAAALLLAVAGIAAYAVTRPSPTPTVAPPVVYPHTGRCDHPDALTRQPCRAVRELLNGANDGDPELYCRHAVPRRLYRECVRDIAFSDSKSFSDHQTLSFGVLAAQLRSETVARVRVRVRPVDGSAVVDAYVWLVREYSWWRVFGTSCASCAGPTPAA